MFNSKRKRSSINICVATAAAGSDATIAYDLDLKTTSRENSLRSGASGTCRTAAAIGCRTLRLNAVVFWQLDLEFGWLTGHNLELLLVLIFLLVFMLVFLLLLAILVLIFVLLFLLLFLFARRRINRRVFSTAFGGYERHSTRSRYDDFGKRGTFDVDTSCRILGFEVSRRGKRLIVHSEIKQTLSVVLELMLRLLLLLH